MGKGEAKEAKSATQAQIGIAREVADIARGLVTESAPARQAALGYYSAIMKGSRPETLLAAAPQVAEVSNQMTALRRRAEQLPPGGLRDKALRDIALQEAAMKTQIYAGGVPEAAARLASMGYGGTQAGVGAFGQAGQGLGSAAQNMAALSQMKAQSWAGLAGGIGALAGGKI